MIHPSRHAIPMTQKIFWQDAYLTELNTTVASVRGNDITVAETIFYALSGGQESDAGSIGGHPVLQARKDGKDIVYTLEEGHGLQAGDAATIHIDWTRRYRLMRLHFAAEIVLELVNQAVPGIVKIGAHIAADKARIDFEYGENISALFPALQQQAMAIIKADQAIVSAFSDEAQERRYWGIAEFSQVPCGGTHLKKTGEIGPISLKRKNVGKGKERIEIYVGELTR